MIDISGPSLVIDGSSAFSFRYCVALIANECVAGSAAGDLYANAPQVNIPYCNLAGQATQDFDDFDLCFGDMAEEFNALVHFGLTSIDNAGGHSRVLTRAFSEIRHLSSFYASHQTPDGAWATVEVGNYGGFSGRIIAVKVPPVATPGGTVNGLKFVPVVLTIPQYTGTGAANVTNAIVEFGYAEYGGYPALGGSSTQLFCTSRAETCAVGMASNPTNIDPVNPFYWETTEAVSLTGTPCASGCSIAIPADPYRAVYARIVYRNSSNGVVHTSYPTVQLTGGS